MSLMKLSPFDVAARQQWIEAIGHELGAGRASEAHDKCVQALAAFPDDGAFWMLCGLARHAQGETRSACRALETASALTPLSCEAQYALAECYATLGKLEPAATICVHLLEHNALPPHLWPYLTRLLASLGDEPGALRACQRASELDPLADGAFFGAAHYMSRLGYPTQAVLEVLGQAFALRPQHPPYRLAAARLLDRVGRPADAYQLLRELPAGELRKLKCVGCLERLVALFLRFKDDERAAACTSALRRQRRSACDDV